MGNNRISMVDKMADALIAYDFGTEAQPDDRLRNLYRQRARVAIAAIVKAMRDEAGRRDPRAFSIAGTTAGSLRTHADWLQRIAEGKRDD